MMKGKIEGTPASRRAPARSSRWVFALLYIGVIGAVIYFNIVSLGEERLLSPQTWILAAILLLLLGVERLEQHWSEGQEAVQVAIVLLVARAVLLAGVTALDPSGISAILYPIIPYAAYFSLGERVGDFLAIITWGVFVSVTWFTGNAWYANDSLTSTIVFTLILVFMMVMARSIHDDEASRHHTEELLADLEVSHRQLQVYADQIAELAVMEERNRLARDIHDSVGHYLTVVNIQLEKALALRHQKPDEAELAIQEAKHAAGEALRDVRRSVGALRNSDANFSLTDELQSLVKGLEGGGIQVSISFEGDERDYPRMTLMALYRATQEGLTNIQKHAQAQNINLKVYLGQQEGMITLQDDGRGFITTDLPELVSASPQSFGLQGIQERLELVGGQLTIHSDPDQGTELVVWVPKEPFGQISGKVSERRARISSPS